MPAPASTRSRNIALPCPRRPITRPATRTCSPVSVPGSRLSKRARTSAIGERASNVTGYGSPPASRTASTLAMRSARICSSVPVGWDMDAQSTKTGCDSGRVRPLAGSDPGSARPRPVPMVWGPSLRGFDAHDLELDRAGWCGYLDHVALLVPEHRPAHGRLVREPAIAGVGLGRSDDLVLVRLTVVNVLDLYFGADRDNVLGDVAGVDHTRRAQLLLELRDPRLEQRLLVLGVVVL